MLGKYGFVSSLIVSSLCSSAQISDTCKQDKPLPDPICRIFKLNPAAMASGPIPVYSGSYGIIYETPISHRQSIQVGIAVVGKGAFFNLYERYSMPAPYGTGVSVKGTALQFAWKIYRNTKRKQAPRGWYAAPLVRVATSGIGRTYAYSTKGEYLEFDNFDINLIIGYQRLRKTCKGLVFDFFFGGGYKQYEAEMHATPGVSQPYSLKSNPLLYSPVNIIGGMTLGWGFCSGH